LSIREKLTPLDNIHALSEHEAWRENGIVLPYERDIKQACIYTLQPIKVTYVCLSHLRNDDCVEACCVAKAKPCENSNSFVMMRKSKSKANDDFCLHIFVRNQSPNPSPHIACHLPHHVLSCILAFAQPTLTHRRSKHNRY